jgi:hypothetical protein
MPSHVGYDLLLTSRKSVCLPALQSSAVLCSGPAWPQSLQNIKIYQPLKGIFSPCSSAAALAL